MTISKERAERREWWLTRGDTTTHTHTWGCVHATTAAHRTPRFAPRTCDSRAHRRSRSTPPALRNDLAWVLPEPCACVLWVFECGVRVCAREGSSRCLTRLARFLFPSPPSTSSGVGPCRCLVSARVRGSWAGPKRRRSGWVAPAELSLRETRLTPLLRETTIRQGSELGVTKISSCGQNRRAAPLCASFEYVLLQAHVPGSMSIADMPKVAA